MHLNKLTIPSKVMLNGEYSCLFGHKALALTLNRFMHFYYEPSTEKEWGIDSDFYPKILEGPLNELLFDQPNDLLLQALSFYQQKTSCSPFKIQIKSKIKPSYGLGSSSALRLGLAMICLNIPSIHDHRIADAIDLGWQSQKNSQGAASGYDLITQAYAGLVESQTQQNKTQFTFTKQTLSTSTKPHELIDIFVGTEGAPTSSQLNNTLAELTENKQLQHLILVQEALLPLWKIFLNGEWSPEFCSYLLKKQQIFLQCSNYPQKIHQALSQISNFGKNFVYQLTGAGGEDAILLMGPERQKAFGTMQNLGFKKLDWTFYQTSKNSA